jgi:hypothetical protein
LAEELNESEEEYGLWWAQKRIAIDERDEVREQRDRLAEALRDLCETLLKGNTRDITELLNKAGDALVAVKGGSDE